MDAADAMQTWFDRQCVALGEVAPEGRRGDPAIEAYIDRVLAHAEATGALVRVVCAAPTSVEASDGTASNLAPGASSLSLDASGRAYLLVAG